MKAKQMTANELVAFRNKEQEERAKVIAEKLNCFQGFFALRSTEQLRKDVERICLLHPKVKDELMMLIPMIQNRSSVNVILAQINEPKMTPKTTVLQKSDFTEYALGLGNWDSLTDGDESLDEVHVVRV